MNIKRMVPSAPPGWPKWCSVYHTWQNARVPDVQILPFNLAKHTPYLPWFSLERNQQFSTSNPVLDTAHHLLELALKTDDELKAAYKLHAFCREKKISPDFLIYVLAPIFQRCDPALCAWNCNAKYVLPSYHNTNLVFEQRYDFQRQRWKQLVQDAASAWTTIAERWAVIRIPGLMDRDSEEYNIYCNHVRALSEKHERLEYERLKRKFEG